MVSGSTQQILYPEDYLCKCADEYILCKAKQYIVYHRYKVGSIPDIDLCLKVARLRRLVCEGKCGLCPEEEQLLKERFNKILLAP